jgi:hypothetical protein
LESLRHFTTSSEMETQSGSDRGAFAVVLNKKGGPLAAATSTSPDVWIGGEVMSCNLKRGRKRRTATPHPSSRRSGPQAREPAILEARGDRPDESFTPCPDDGCSSDHLEYDGHVTPWEYGDEF